MYGVVLAITLAITGGAIAFIGDRLGSKVGKKKLSIFGLRPRHTSILVTIVTGILITTMTLGVSALVSKNVRTALFGMERLNRTMQQTQANLMTTQADLATTQADLTDTQKQKEEADEALNKSQDQVEKLQAQQKQLQEESARLMEGNRLLEAAKQELTARNSELYASNSALTGENQQLLGVNEDLTDKNTKLVGDNSKLTEENTSLEKSAKALQNGLISMREGDIFLRAGEVIASGVIEGGRPAEKIQQDLGMLAQIAGRNVSTKGAKDQNIWIYQPELDAAIQTISKSKKDMVVRIVAAGNQIRGEEVRATLELHENSIIYTKNEFILARTYDLSGATRGDVETVLMSFLSEVNQAAASRGMLRDPLQGSIGIIEASQFYDVVNQMMPIHGSAILSAYARENTDVLGPLRLNIKVEREGTTGAQP